MKQVPAEDADILPPYVYGDPLPYPEAFEDDSPTAWEEWLQASARPLRMTCTDEVTFAGAARLEGAVVNPYSYVERSHALTTAMDKFPASTGRETYGSGSHSLLNFFLQLIDSRPGTQKHRSAVVLQRPSAESETNMYREGDFSKTVPADLRKL